MMGRLLFSRPRLVVCVFYCFSSALNLFESNETCLALRWGSVFQLEFYHMKVKILKALF